MKKLKKILNRIYWRYLWYPFYSRMTTYGVQIYWNDGNRWRFNNEIHDKVFFSKKRAYAFWEKHKAIINKDKQGCLWLIEKGNYTTELETVNY